VIALDDLSTGRHANITHLLDRPDFEFVLGSILNVDLLDDVVGRADVVFHLAAAVGVELIVERPVESLRTNVMGSELVIEKAHKYTRPVLVTSTSEIYGKNDSDRLREDDDRILGSPLKSRWSYSEAKAIEEILAYTYWRQKGLPAVITRLFNTVGPRQTGYYGMVIPRFVSQALRGEPITVYGDGKQTRCFCHVSDIVSPLIDLITHEPAHGQVLNLGGVQEISIEDLAHRVIELTGSESTLRFVSYEEAYEEGFEDMPRRVPDVTRAKDLIGFEPQHDLDAILRSVIAEQRG
jgi:UDP-glucose 4-epimerase